ncbi:hypothetical protein [Rhodoferax sp. WC2427]|uniref:hypothetical protein n=1 Tax=Rhodoferax sp. WC2427 TaxID=3234144 RepID=UPI0034662AB4
MSNTKMKGPPKPNRQPRLVRQHEQLDLNDLPNVIVAMLGNLETALISAGAVANKDYYWPMLIEGAIKLAAEAGFLKDTNVILEDIESSPGSFL